MGDDLPRGLVTRRRLKEGEAPKILVVLDTTTIRAQERRLYLGQLESLFKTAPKLGLAVRMPFVVMLEGGRAAVEEFDDYAKAFGEAQRAHALLSFPAPTYAAPPRSDVLQAVERKIHEMSRGNDFAVLPIPEAPHDEVLIRDLRREKPFNASGKGYRDTLIWLSLLDAAKREKPQKVFFVTNNVEDFGDKKSKKLHPALASEASRIGVPVELVRDVFALTKHHLAPMLKPVEAAVGKPVSVAFPDAEKALLAALEAHLDGKTHFYELGDDVPDDEIVLADPPEIGKVHWARQLDADQVLVEVGARMSVIASYDASEPEAGLHHLVDYESGDIVFTIQAVIEKGQVASAQVLPLDGNDFDLGELSETDQAHLSNHFEREEEM